MQTDTVKTDDTSLTTHPPLNRLFNLPDIWDQTQDLLIIAGEGGEHAAQLARTHGQERILLFVPSEYEMPVRLPQDIMVANNLQEVMNHLFVLRGESPAEIICLRGQNCTYTLEFIHKIVALAEYSIIQRKSNESTVAAFGQLWGLNGIRNLPEIAQWPIARDLMGAFTDKPMIIVNPGPSLGHDIEHLKRAKGRAIIVCVNHAISALSEAGIVPDFVITLEPQDISYHFDSSDLTQIEGHLIAATSNPKIYQIPTSRILTYTGNEMADQWIYDIVGEDKAEIIGGGSVSCTAMTLGLLWGCDPIINLGLDLSFPEGQYYTSSTCDGNIVANINSDDGKFVLRGYSEALKKTELYADLGRSPSLDLCHVPAVSGGTVPTSKTFEFYLNWFQVTAADHCTARNLVNCSQKGAFIEGMEHLPFEQTLAKYVPNETNLDIRLTLDRVFDNHNGPNRLELVRNKLAEMNQYIASANKYASQCMKLSTKAATNQKALNKLGRVEKQLIQSLKPLFVASLLDQKQITDAVKRGNEATTMEESLDAAKTLYRLVLKAHRELATPIKETLDRTTELLRQTSN